MGEASAENEAALSALLAEKSPDVNNVSSEEFSLLFEEMKSPYFIRKNN